ncbi:hypothetical protein A3H85_00950 [Candidatus Daviesbacteria bacterium RIFCSPLOWO2_02_FULL_40_8]|uniref:YqgF/RNase H-like domain-containing protein n=1 Tax=Candidatus Daviesbacteria bacterium RIFCSPLOWO2_01_FULL_40_24 TaxID=1797787 RepID=A0A1F5MKG9_9BACT|nr:MAG: hypothetical protein A2780_00610 [Candidatus Daviesbacteria bacterium RIFCSPHIGHO2_01_FULL_41_45]OGE34340.1 MAG: hypothetical protein A3C32_01975 [Candidatus Daviesbacteria bacterium RIFCSPHIGHO2_02_FULL_41_14]OGE65887.1 MAG: hypothetical protein A3B49_00245 [Candidatus Daviesbacteria bacterium RIFCSPLOWO2_01_FULL_40_24]OGE67033.1 MAG: hypothetical protein A3H85_00950 [Candidatus Daviesbacteria bacterium RIFCSPLOWO2_02_FULL_40_8]
MKYLGIDWGLKSLGFAVSEGIFSSPLKEVKINSLNQALDMVCQVVKSAGIDIIIVGLPDSGEVRMAVEKGVVGLKKLGMMVKLADETLTTHNSNDHQGAATLILQGYLDDSKTH